MINDIRRAHPALHWLRNIRLPPRRRRELHRLLQAPRGCPTARDDVVVVVANLDPHATRATTRATSTWPRWASSSDDTFEAHDLVTDETLELAAATTTSGSGPRSNPCTSSP